MYEDAHLHRDWSSSTCCCGDDSVPSTPLLLLLPLPLISSILLSSMLVELSIAQIAVGIRSCILGLLVLHLGSALTHVGE